MLTKTHIKNYFFIFLLFSIFHYLFLFPAQAQPVTQAHTTVDFISDVKSIQAGKSFWIGLRMKMDPEWHVYWRNPGDSGLPPSIAWKLPDGVTAGVIQWPYPKRINVGPLTSFGFEEEVILWSEISLPAHLPFNELTVRAKVDWLTCKIECIPGQADFSLVFPVVNESEKNIEAGEWLEKDRFNWPARQSDWSISARQNEKDFIFLLSAENPQGNIKSLQFFPYNDTLIQHAAAQELRFEHHEYILTIPKSFLITKSIDELEGILVSDKTWDYNHHYHSLEIKVPVEQGVEQGRAVQPVKSSSLTLIVACWFAFLGGIILNFMPCVLPVLSLKIIGLVKTVRDRRKMMMSGIIFTLGVLVSFWILAGCLMVFQSAGHKLGWGFQFQSPVFVAVMSGILFLLALNLFGVFEIGIIGYSSGNIPAGYGGNFMSGVLAVWLATPCTAPFMGTALSFAITQPAVISWVIFTCLGFGLATPFLLLSIFPQWLSFLPKPGQWMNILKVVFGFILLLCVVWLGWVLNLQKGIFAIVILMIGLAIMGMAAVAGGLFQRQGNPLSFVLIFLLFVSGGLMFMLTGLKFLPQKMAEQLGMDGKGIVWQKFSLERLAKIRREEKSVLVDFTAAWCLTCQVNDRLVFQNERVVEYFKQSGIVALKADWTNHSEEITEALTDYGKNSIPVYAFYRSGSQQPVFLPEILTPEIALKILRKNLN